MRLNSPRPPHRVRAVALDLDGTTLNPQHRLSSATISAVRQVTQQGIKVVLASGRLPHSIIPYAQQLALEGVHIGLNGGVAFELDGRLRHQHLLTREQLAFGLKIAEDAGLEALVFGCTGIWCTKLTAEVEYVVSFGEPPARLFTPETCEVIESPVKILTLLPSGPRDQILARQVHPHLEAIRTGPRFLEFLAPTVNKGRAFAELLDDWGLARHETMAVGDSENDASLFDVVGFSVAMGNAIPGLKSRSHATTLSNADDGVAHALQRFVLEQ